MRKITKFFRESYEELKKVVWPSRQTVVRHTISVILTVAISMVIIMVLDYGLQLLVGKLINYSK